MCLLPSSENLSLAETYIDGNRSLQSNPMNVTLFDAVTEQVASALNVYYTPILVTLGSIGNFISIFVFFNGKLRHQSTSQYLSALAISDTVFLLQLLPPWLNAVQYTGLFHRSGFCQIFVYISYVTCCLSAWLVVAFTIERFVAVVYPLRRSSVCTVTRARHVIASLVVSALVLNIPVLRFAVPSKNDCNIDFEYLEHAARFNLVDTALSFTVPLAMIIFLNSWIMVGVCTLERARQQMMKDDEPVDALAEQPRNNRCHPHSQQRVTKMLLIVSSVFVMLNLPAYTMRILAYAYDMSAGEYSGRWAALQQLALMFFNTNFGINFILYCVTGQNFRRALVQAIPWLRRRARRRAVARRAAFLQPGRTNSVSTGSGVSNCTEATCNYAPAALNYNAGACSYSAPGGSCIGAPRCCYVTLDAAMPGPSRPRAVSSCTARPGCYSMTTNYCAQNTSGRVTSAITCLPGGSNRSLGIPGYGCSAGTRGYCATGPRDRSPGANYCAACPSGRQAETSFCVPGSVSNYPVASTNRFLRNVDTHQTRNRYSGSFIRRWTFDNSRQQQRQPSIEMQEFNQRANRLELE